MKFSNLERIGRFLCQMYYTGVLKPSAWYPAGSTAYQLSQCVEATLEDISGKQGKTGAVLRSLMAGDLTKLRQHERDGLMGGRAFLEGEVEGGEVKSIDGGCLCTAEVGMYALVGKNFKRLLV